MCKNLKYLGCGFSNTLDWPLLLYHPLQFHQIYYHSATSFHESSTEYAANLHDMRVPIFKRMVWWKYACDGCVVPCFVVCQFIAFIEYMYLFSNMFKVASMILGVFLRLPQSQQSNPKG